MSYPWQSVLNSKYRWAFWPMAALTLVLTLILGTIPLNPSILQFELAGNGAEASKILHSWETPGQIRAAFGLGLAFLDIVAYSTTISSNKLVGSVLKC